jgi:hypothetical protein
MKALKAICFIISLSIMYIGKRRRQRFEANIRVYINGGSFDRQSYTTAAGFIKKFGSYKATGFLTQTRA